MKKSRFSEEQIVGILKQGEAGVVTGDLCQQHGVSYARFYNWKANYGSSGSKRSTTTEAAGKRRTGS